MLNQSEYDLYYEMYITEGKTPRVIAQYMSVKIGHVKYMIRKFGIRKQQCSALERLRRCGDMIRIQRSERFWSVSLLARHYKCANKTMIKFLKEQNERNSNKNR